MLERIVCLLARHRDRTLNPATGMVDPPDQLLDLAREWAASHPTG